MLPLTRVWGGLRLVLPLAGGRKYLAAISVWKAVAAGFINFLLVLPWLVVMQTSFEWYLRHRSVIPMRRPMKLLTLPYRVEHLEPPKTNDWLVLLRALVRADWQGFGHESALILISPALLLLWRG